MQLFWRGMDVGCNHNELAKHCVFIQYIAHIEVGKECLAKVEVLQQFRGRETFLVSFLSDLVMVGDTKFDGVTAAALGADH